ncbi:MAG: GNAT family N-acetyltransferase [Balneolaceae bacterium]
MQLLQFQEEIMSDNEYVSNVKQGKFAEYGLSIEIYEGENAFDQLASDWIDLARQTDAMVCMTYEWARTWWKYFGKNSQRSPYIVTVWNGSKIVALAPFYKGVTKLNGNVLESRLQLIGSGGSENEQLGYLDDYGISDFLDILVDEKYRFHVARIFCKAIGVNYFEADKITFHQARDDSFIMKYFLPRLKKTNVEYNLEKTDTCPFIDLSRHESMKGYIKKLKSNARRRIKKTRREMAPEGCFSIKKCETWDDVEKATESLIRLHQDRWNKIGFPGVFHDDRFTGFFKETLRYAFDNGWLWFSQAEDEEGVCACRMLLRYNNRYFDYISGFDDESPSSKYRPGIALLVKLIEDALEEEGVSHVELLRGEEGYKYDFTKDNLSNWKLTFTYKDDQKMSKKWTRSALTAIAMFYKRARAETKLMKVQKENRGIFQMIPQYLLFRWNSYKIKRNSSN